MGPVRASAPPQTDPEWLQTFRAFSTEVAQEATPLTAEVDFAFSGRHQSRTIVEAVVRVPREAATPVRLGDRESYNFQLTGEVLREGDLFESFRYRFDLPALGAFGEPLSLVFERYLRPGAYSIVVKVEDLHGGGVFRQQREIEVPAVDAGERLAERSEAGELEGQPPAAESGVVLAGDGARLQSGYSRFSAQVSGAVSKVAFLLNDRPVLTKTRPPYSVELDLGALPRTHTVRAVGYDAAGNEVATDEIIINPGEHSFIVRLIEPEAGKSYSGVVRARAEVDAPEGSLVERVEFYLNDERLATLFQPPFVQLIRLADTSVTFVRVVAFLKDGNSTDDLVLFNAGQFLEDVEVRLVELYATVVDRAGRPIPDLAREDFRVTEDGQDQELVRFERLDDLPIYAALLIDTSASMAENLDEVRRVALGFFEQIIQSKDRAAVITFSDRPRLAAKFTNDMTTVAGALAGLTAERSTALYDSLLFGLYYFQGIKGQRAMLVLSDGEDRRSKTTFEEVLEYALSAGVTLYTVGLDISNRQARVRLRRLAEETGGRAFFIESVEELDAITAAVERDLRSRYLLAYQAPQKEGQSFRVVDVRVSESDAEVRTLRGYYP